MSKQFFVEPFTNEYGQVINPGDEVLQIGRSYGCTSSRKSTYLGVYKDYVQTGHWENGKYIHTGKKFDVVAVRCISPGMRFKWDAVARTGEYVPSTRTSILWYKQIYKLAA